MQRFWAALAAVSILAGCATAPRVEEQKITVLTYNIHHGEGVDGKLDLERIASVIKSMNPDLVALQEVDRKTQRTGGVDQAGELARLAGMRHVFGKAMDYQGGEYGQAILSRWPIDDHEVHVLPQRDGREPRISLAAKVNSPFAADLVFASTHLDHQVEEIRVQQAEALTEIFGRRTGPTLLAGDFNAIPSSQTMGVFGRAWVDSAGTNATPTIPAAKPTRRIDYILVRPGGRWRTLENRVLDEAVASDHRPVLSVFEIRN